MRLNGQMLIKQVGVSRCEMRFGRSVALFSYFSDNYPWNLALLSALDLGVPLADIDRACGSFRDTKFDTEGAAAEAWSNAWLGLGDRLILQSKEDDLTSLTVADRKRRAAVCYLMAERGIAPGSPEKLAVYRKGIDAFAEAIVVRDARAKLLSIPYRDKSLPALFTSPEGDGPFPCMIFFQGLDWIKEFYFLQMAEAFTARGIACLFVDQPGAGGALRIHGMVAETETEHAAGACIDILESMPLIDPSRIGIHAISLGGYYAPRAAAFEKRLACVIAWGAIWNYMELLQLSLSKGADYANSVPHMRDHLGWVFGVTSLEEIIPIFQKIDLADVAPLIECPFLIVHGKSDAQVPVDQATRSYNAAINAAKRKLVVLDEETGGVEHCNLDNLPLVREIMADWSAKILRVSD